MKVTRIFELLDRYSVEYPDLSPALAGKENETWKSWSAQEYVDDVNNLSAGLLSLGIAPGDKIATIANNRPEWNVIDMAVMQIGAIHVPIYPTISDSDYEYILNHAEVKLVFVSGEEMFRRIRHIIPNIPSVQAVYTFRNLNGIEHLNELIEHGKKNPQSENIGKIRQNTGENDLATIIYTSGTTGNPKGVMLSHKNLVSNFTATSGIPPYGQGTRVLSFLPLCHVYERMLNYMYQYNGYCIYYAENLGTIANNMKEVQPQIISTVPRLLESIFDKIMSNGRKLKGFKRKIFDWAVKTGLKYERQGWNPLYAIKLFIARKLVFVKWQEALGGRLDIIVSGGAALQVRLSRVFWAAGFRVLEGYGLTETSPVIAVSNLEKNGVQFGTVGLPIKGVLVRIADDGEILCKGDNVMLGYYKEPQLTAEVIDQEGWFHTGDIGIITIQGQLKITDRKKSLFKTSAGKYISPQTLENKFRESPLIGQVMVVGENQKHPSALIVPNFEFLKTWIDDGLTPAKKVSEVVSAPDFKKKMQDEIDYYNRFFGDTEQIKRFEIIDEEWSIKTGELTPSLKLKRPYIMMKYKNLIDKIYRN
ncbi:MAG: long-chain fatty acid--CoA ligase [Bacteroidetes bacterium]|nr:long-chain fatty acid--CoA ligase [Bacteroidota bacterium]MBU1718994.1 long-chain fatty acid--CoA ligase [Bacteroidota bacterium]